MAAPSAAGPLGGSLTVFTTVAGFDVCVETDSTAWGDWVLQITGARVHDGEPPWMELPETPPTTYSGAGVNVCDHFWDWGYPYGEFQATFSYVAPGGTSVVVAVGGGTWDPETGHHPWSVSPG